MKKKRTKVTYLPTCTEYICTESKERELGKIFKSRESWIFLNILSWFFNPFETGTGGGQIMVFFVGEGWFRPPLLLGYCKEGTSKLHSMACSTNMHFLSKAPGVHRHHVTVWTPDPWNQGILNRFRYSNAPLYPASRCVNFAYMKFWIFYCIKKNVMSVLF